MRTPRTFRFPALAALLLSAWSLTGAQSVDKPPDAAPKDPLTLGNALYDKGDYSAAAAQYLKATRNAHGLQSSFAWFNLGNCQVQVHAYPKAIVAYRRSLEEAPNFSRAYQVLGDVYYTLDAIPEAVVAYTHLEHLEETSFHARQMLGECALRVDDVTDALRYFDAAAQIDPEVPDLYMSMAEADASIRDYPAAEKVLDEALVRMERPTADAYFYLGQIYELDSNTVKAVRAYEEGLLLAPKRADYYLRIAEIHQHEGEDFLALLALEDGIRAGVDQADFHLRRGLIYFGQRRYDHALEEFLAAYRLGDGRGKTGIKNVVAAYFNAGDKDLSQAAADSLAAIRNRD